MGTNYFDSRVINSAGKALDFVGNVLQSSTECSVIGKDLDGKSLLWSEGAMRMYGYEFCRVVARFRQGPQRGRDHGQSSAAIGRAIYRSGARFAVKRNLKKVFQ